MMNYKTLFTSTTEKIPLRR